MEPKQIAEKIRTMFTEHNLKEPQEDDILSALAGLDSENKWSDEFIGDDEKLGAWIDSVLGEFAPKT